MRRRAPLLALVALLFLTPVAAAETTTQTLERLGGKPCSKTSSFTCVAITVPLDHANPTNGETLRVAFAVQPAQGKSRGLLVVATGGPGSAGIAYADNDVAKFPERVQRRYDVVFFDQRGIGRSGGVDCPQAQRALALSTASDEESASAFAAACTAELRSTRVLPWAGTDQAVADLEAFRVALGAPKVWLYGVSYGTQYGQTYAARYPQAMGGLILDGVVDLTLTAPAFWTDAARGMEEGLDAVLRRCNARPACRANMGDDAVRAFDEMQATLRAGPVPVRFTLGSGRQVTRPLTLAMFEGVTTSLLYSPNGRMLLQRTLASASRGDLQPFLELFYYFASLNPQNLVTIPDPSYSLAMYYGVDCRDYSWYAGSREERNAAFLAQHAQVGALYPRLGASTFTSDYPCIFWPTAAPDVPRPAPLTNPGIPTLVLNAEADPITTVAQARSVAGRLDDGYLIVQRGGAHVIYGRGERCVDTPVNNFLTTGKPPARRSITCRGVDVRPYVGIGPPTAAGFANVTDAVRSFVTQFDYSTPSITWDGEAPLRAGCNRGGTMRATSTRSGQTRAGFRACSFTPGLAVTGSATIDPAGRLTGTLRLTGRFPGTYRVTKQGTRVQVARVR